MQPQPPEAFSLKLFTTKRYQDSFEGIELDGFEQKEIRIYLEHPTITKFSRTKGKIKSQRANMRDLLLLKSYSSAQYDYNHQQEQIVFVQGD